MNVLIGVGPGSSGNEIVLKAASRPWPAGTEFLLLTVLDPFPFVKAPLLLERARDADRRHAEKLAEDLIHAGWRTRVDVVLGNSRRRINIVARDWKADLVMVGSHEIGWLTRLFVGSTAQSVLRGAPCSVEIVRPFQSDGRLPVGGPIKILAATDGSEFSEAALCSLAERPWPAGSTAKVISIPELILPLREFPYFEPHEVEDLNIASIDEAKAAAAAGVKILSTGSLKICCDIPAEQEMPWRLILREAEKWQADMIVVGSHGRRGFDRLTMGSVSEAVALHAKCSVEVIRKREAQPGKSEQGDIQ
jgi:nucleotide-binding universal stress UspA family protein